MLICDGTREQLIAELRERAVGWYCLCKDSLAEASARAADKLEEGADTVSVGHTLFRVIE